MRLQDLTEEKRLGEENLNEAKTKIWELREIVSNLEKELATSRENEAGLAAKISEFETLFDTQYQAHQHLVVEFETMKQNAKVPEVPEAAPLDLSALHQIKTQILWLERSLSRRTKELEGLYVFDANLSSPSEDISARDEMVNTPDSGRVDSPGLPLEQMSSLYEQFVRHSRAEDATVKCLRDTVLQLTGVRSQLSEVQHERDALQARYNKTLAELSEAKVQLEELRHTLFEKKTDREEEKHAAMDLLEDKVKTLAKALLIKDEEMKEKERQIEHKDRMMWSLEQELSSKIDLTESRLRDASHVSHSELKPRRIASPVVRFNDTTLNETAAPFNDSDHNDLQEQNKRLKEELLQKEQIIVEIKADADALKNVLNELQDKVNEAKRHSENITEQEHAVEEYKLEIGRNQETIERYEEEMKKLSQELEDLSRQNNEFNQDNVEYKKEIDRLNVEINELQDQCSECESNNIQLRSQIETCEKEFGKLIKEFSLSDDDKTRGSMHIVALEDFVDVLRKELQSYVENIELNKAEKCNLEDQVRRIQEQLTNMKLKESQKKKTIQTTEEKLLKFENEIENLKQNEVILKNQLDRVNLSCEMYKSKASEVDKKEELIRKLKENIELSEQNFAELEREVNELREKEQEMADKKLDKEQLVETLRGNLDTTDNGNKECEQCKEFMRDQTTRLTNQLALSFAADQSATASFDIKSLKDEMFSELAEKLRKELQLSAKLDEKLLSKQKDYAYEQQDHIIQTLTEDKRKLRELLLAERARFETEQLQDADLLEKLRNKLEANKETYKKTIQDLENEIQHVVQEKADLISKLNVLEKSLETYRTNSTNASEQYKKLEIQFNEKKALLEETHIQFKLESSHLNTAREKIKTLENELTRIKDQLAKSSSTMSKSDMEKVIQEQISSITLAMQEKLLTEQKVLEDSVKKQLEERIKSLTETLMVETKKVLKLETELEIRKTELSEQAELVGDLRDKLREKDMNLEMEKERVTTLREKLLEKSKTLGEEMEKCKILEEKARSLHHEVDVLVGQRHHEVDQGKQVSCVQCLCVILILVDQ